MMLLSRFTNPTWSTFTKKILKKAEGWVLFINEAYTFSSTSGKDHGNEGIETTMAKMNAN